MELKPQTESPIWKNSFWVFSAILLAFMPILSKDYGLSGDEWLQIDYGRHIWEYFFEGNRQALDYSKMSLQYQGIEFYGGLFDFGTEILHRWFPSVHLLSLRHFCNAIFGAVLLIFSGKLVFRLTRSWQAAFIALLFIAFSPRIFGESMNNPKDIPFACGFIVGTYYFLALLQDAKTKLWGNCIGLAVGFAIAFGVRPAGGLLLVFYFVVMGALWFLLHKDFRTVLKADKNKLFKKMMVGIVLSLAAGYVTGLLCWPWGLQEPLTRPLESLKQMTNISITIPVFFEGAFHPNNQMPWYYEFKWIIISNPLIVIAGAALFIVMLFRAKKEYGAFTVYFLLFAAFFTPLYMIYKKSSVHDTWRHLFFVYPFYVSMAAIGIYLIGQYVKNERLRWLPAGIAVAGLLPAIIWTFRVHPNEYVYFNESVGGVKGAYGYYDIDYYYNSGKQAADWIVKNGKKGADGKIIVLTNMGGYFILDFGKDSAHVLTDYVKAPERHTRSWDYYVFFPRYMQPEKLMNDKWPPKDAVHVITAGGVPLSAILESKSKAGAEAYKAFQEKDFVTAAQKYASYVQEEPDDEGAMTNYGIALYYTGQPDAAIAVLTKSAELDPGQPFYYETIAKIYQEKGDMQKAQEAMNMANAIKLKQMEEAE